MNKSIYAVTSKPTKIRIISLSLEKKLFLIRFKPRTFVGSRMDVFSALNMQKKPLIFDF